MQQVDLGATQTLGLPDLVLMEHAAIAVRDALCKRFGSLLTQTRGAILAGPGNNGGDALAVARLLHELGLRDLVVVLPLEGKGATAAAARQLQILGKLGIPWTKGIDSEALQVCDWLVDGLFGTGLTRALAEPFASLVALVNEQSGKKWIVAIDCPSGLSCDTGVPLGSAVHASETVALGFLKKGLVTGQAADYVGQLSLAPIQIPRTIPFPTGAFLYTHTDARRLPKRRPAGHKGDYGHVYVCAGQANKEGAALISSMGALATGAGLVSLIGSADALSLAKPRLAVEFMTQPFAPEQWPAEKPGTVIVIGPGMGIAEPGWRQLASLLKTRLTIVADADALNLLAEHSEEAERLLRQRRDAGLVTVLTPHPKEASRLLQISTEALEADRYQASAALADQWNATIVLKGKGTIVYSPGGPHIVVNSGNSALSKGGTGDLLAGILAALLAQQLTAVQAAPLAVYLHGLAAENLSAAGRSERSVTATELADALKNVLAELEAQQ